MGVSILKNISNVAGWRTRKKLVVFESDDWGSIRMPSKLVFENIARYGIDLYSDEGCVYNKYDSFASTKDLTCLFEVLDSVKDITSRAPVMTPISVVANPDFQKIKASGFSEYFYEPFVVTLTKYPDCEGSFSLWEEGIKKRLFVPQFHGREHLNVKVWMRALQSKNKIAMVAFNNGLWGISTASDNSIKVEFQAAFNFIDPGDLDYQREVIFSGLDLFEKLFGYRATYFVPPNGCLSSRLEPLCVSQGVKYLSINKIQAEPIGYGKTKKRFHWLGQKANTGITYLTRNCFFEPVQRGHDWVDSCMSDVSNAFKWNKPAIISSHRVNYIGSLDVSNRDKGLTDLRLLFKTMIRTWPDIEFHTSSELGNLICNGRCHD